jgi:hypothetical protein
LRGVAQAKAQTTGTTGTAMASATSAGDLIINLATTSSAPTSGTSQAQAHASVTNILPAMSAAPDADDAVGIESAVFAVGAPKLSDAQSYFAGNPVSRGFFNLPDDTSAGLNSDLLGLVTMGGSYGEGTTGSRICTSSATFAIDLSSLPNPRQDLVLALLDTNAQGGGFDSMTFTVSREGSLVVNQTFATVAAANAFLNDNVLNLGSNGVGNVSGNLDLIFSLSLTTNDVGAGYSFDLLFGNATAASADFDADGKIDGNDFLTWQRGLGVGTTRAAGDADGNGTVNAADLTVWRNTYGFTASTAAAAGAVPEPGTMAMILLAAASLIRRRR